MKDDIAAGMRNALARGFSLEQAVQSFLNAGYNPNEVKEAQMAVTGGVSNVVYPEASTKPALTKKELSFVPAPPEEDYPVKKKEGSSKIVLISIIVLSSLVFVGALSYLIYTLMK